VVGRRVGGVCAAAAVMSVVLIALPGSVDVLIRIAIGAVVYVAAAFALGVVTRAELRELARSRGSEAAD
jgi:hypothetical protein